MKPMTFGYLPDPIDERDKPFDLVRALLPTASPTKLAVLPITSPISNQGPVGTCVSNAVCDAVEILSGRPSGILVVHSLEEANAFLRDDIPPPVDLSRMHVDFLSRLSHGGLGEEGTYIRNAMGVLKNIGVCRESKWRYDLKHFGIRPPILALQDAWQHLIGGYYRIYVSSRSKMGRDVRAAIDAGLPVVHAKDVGKEYLNAYGVEDDFVAGVPARSDGGHATVIVGYRMRADGTFEYLDRNSHGREYGLAKCPGHVWISEAYLATARDLWVPTQKWVA